MWVMLHQHHTISASNTMNMLDLCYFKRNTKPDAKPCFASYWSGNEFNTIIIHS